MPIDLDPPKGDYRITVEIDSIGNGYLVQAKARPSSADPMAMRGGSAPFYVREIEDAPKVVEHIIGQMKEAEAAQKRFHDSFAGEPVGEEDEG